MKKVSFDLSLQDAKKLSNIAKRANTTIETVVRVLLALYLQPRKKK